MNRNKGTVTYTSSQNELMTSAKHQAKTHTAPYCPFPNDHHSLQKRMKEEEKRERMRDRERAVEKEGERDRENG